MIDDEAKSGADVEVRSVIYLAGQGTVVVGHTCRGIAHAGQVTGALALGDRPAQRLEVSAVQRLSSLSGSAQAVGIVFRNPPPLNDLKRLLPSGSVLSLEEPVQPASSAKPADPSSGPLAGHQSRR